MPEAEHDRAAQPVDHEEPPRLAFPVVAIGASAGGLESAMEFFSAMRPDSGMAFVLVQLLPPDRESMIAKILATKTSMPVSLVDDGMPVEPDNVYVIRPGRTLTLKDGRFQLGDSLARPMHSRPIDDFFKSLAHEQRERAIAVVMSGMGSNGTAGSQAIKAVGGLCVAQDPESAQFPSMPRHLIDGGCADYILRPCDMPEMLLAYAGHPYARDGVLRASVELQREQQHMREILAVLRTRTRHDFGGYKKATIMRRIQRRMGLARITRLGEYARTLRQTPSEVAALADDLLIHVTGFFRDPEAWEALRERVIVPLVAAREPGSSVRAWVSACSSGEEAYTLTMLLVEEAERVGKSLDIKVFATDTADRTLQNARHGVYPGGIEADVTPQRLERFFQREEAVYRIRQDLRERVVFAPQNVLQDSPFSRLDVITCRNLLIYLEPDVQKRVLSLLHFGLRDGGVLFLGTSETTGGCDELFEPIDKKARIFRRVGPARHASVEFPLPRSAPADLPQVETRLPVLRLSVGQLTTRTLLEQHTPAAVTIDRDYRIVYYHGDTGPFLLQPPGEPTRELMAVVRDTLRGPLRTAAQHAISTGSTASVRDGWIEVDGRREHVLVTVSPIAAKMDPEYFVISFQRGVPAPAPPEPSGPVAPEHLESTENLRRVRDELQSTVEELQTSNEELKAAHEEVVSTNEELQSTNEELETSREEMQSLNEELSTVNSQLHAKMEEYQAVTNDLTSLLTSTDIAVLFLDTRFRIRRYTPQVKELVDVIAGDVGRPLSDLARKFDDPSLIQDATAVLDRLTPLEREIAVDGGRWFLRRITPYRTADNRIDGVVITFVETTARHRIEAALRASEEQFRRSVEDAPVPILVQAENGEVLQLSGAWTELTGYSLPEIPTMEAWLGLVQGDRATLRADLRALSTGPRRTLDAEFLIRTRAGELRHWTFTASASGPLPDGRRLTVVMAVDSTERKRIEAELQASKEAVEAASAMKDRFLANISHELRTPLSVILMWSKLLTRADTTPGQEREAAGAIARSAEAQRRLIDDLLDMTRISSGKLRINFAPVDLAAIIRSAAESVRLIASARKLALHVEISGAIPPVRGDAGRLEQVVWILLTNASKFTPEGGAIRLHLEALSDTVRFQVSDTGFGMDADMLARLFRPFSQHTDPAGHHKGGLGLGLSIAKSLVELHGGSITAHSDGINTGSTFTVTLPQAPDASSVQQRTGERQLHAGRGLAGVSVMVVEDNLDTSRAIQVALESAGAAVTSFADATAGLAQFEKLPPDLIVSDISMPEMDGLAFIRRIREIEAATGARRTRAIALTAMASRTDRRTAISCGFDEFVSKPVDPETLTTLAAAVINRA